MVDKLLQTTVFALAIACGIVAVTVSIIPIETYALSSASCSKGSTLEWARGDYRPYYDYWCIDSSGNKTEPTWTEVKECGANEKISRSTFTNEQICIPASTASTQENPQEPLSCERILDWVGFTCFGRMFSVVIGTALITATAWLLAAAGYLFNILVDHTVVRFGSLLLNAGVRGAIEVGWTALRDIANIVIIAMFVFIAINIILGVKEFGEKRLVARVLIIAVLINFSLLFTKAIIDASNFTAYQFVKASGFVSDTADTQGAFEKEFVKKGIAGEFIRSMGLASVGETYKALSNAAFGSEQNQYATANGWFALLHGLVSATLLSIAAAALLYGSYFLITRAVLLIFLMMTSALAFASWLIPQQRIVRGFARWWETLLKTALFGPLLIIFLWASLNVARAIPQKGTLGAMISDPSQTLNLEALFSYVIVVGLLFASIYAANTLSKGIAGFSAAGSFWLGPTVAAAAVGSRLGGMVGRNTLGWAGQNRLTALRDWYHAPPTDKQALRGVQYEDMWRRRGPLGMINRGLMRGANALATSKFDMLQSKPIAGVVGGIGGTIAKSIVDKTSGLTKEDFRSMMEKKAQTADALARQIGPTNEQRVLMHQQAQQQINTQQRMVEQVREAVHADIRRGQAQRPEAESRVEAHDEAVRRIENERIATRNRQQSEMRMEEQRIARAQKDAEYGGATPEELEKLREPLTRLQETHQEALNVLDEQTRHHQEQLGIAREEVKALNREAENAATRDQRLRDEQEKLRALGTRVDAQEVRFRKQLLWDPRARPFVEGEMRGQAGRRALKDLAAQIRSGEPPAAAPARPPTSPPTP